MVRLTFDDRTSAVKLFDKDEPYHLMTESQPRKRDLVVGAGVYLR